LVGSIFHMTRKIVSEMTYNVSMGTLNPTIPYYTEQEKNCSEHHPAAEKLFSIMNGLFSIAALAGLYKIMKK